MLEKKEDQKENRKNELYARMIETSLTQHATVGDQFRYVRGKGLVKRDMSASK